MVVVVIQGTGAVLNPTVGNWLKGHDARNAKVRLVFYSVYGGVKSGRRRVKPEDLVNGVMRVRKRSGSSEERDGFSSD